MAVENSSRLLLSQLFASDRMPQSNILMGPSGVGKKTFLLEQISKLFCVSKGEKPCGECGPCVRLKHQESEFHLMVSPDDGGSIKVDEIRKIKRLTSLQTLMRRFFIIIDEAESMTLQSSNALLKILEEPSPDCYFFLITSQVNKLPATIRSRAQVLRFHALPLNEMMDASVSPWALNLARTELNLAKKLGTLESVNGKIIDWLTNLLQDRLVPLNISIDKSNYDGFIFFLKSLVRDSLFVQQGLGHKILNSDFKNFVEELSQTESPKLVEAYDKLDTYQNWSYDNVDRALITDNISYLIRSLSHV